jgi:hypothetical protein
MARRPKRKTGADKVGVGMSFDDDKKFLKMLEKLTAGVQNVVVSEAIDEATKPVLRAMIANTPESSGSRNKQSQKTKSRWSGTKKLKTTIKAVVRKKMKFGQPSGAIGLVGPSYSDGGGHGNLFSQRTHNRTAFWGKEIDASRLIDQFVKKTADETASTAASVLTASLAKGIDAAAKKAGA